MSALNCFELSLEGFEWTLDCGEGQLTETGERLPNGCLRSLNSAERQATISESALQAFECERMLASFWRKALYSGECQTMPG